MATQNQSGGTSLDALASLMQMFQGTKSSTTVSGGGQGGFTETKQSNLTEEDLASLLKTALESNQGLAAVTQGQRAAGMYNSSTNKLMTNDLLARLTAQTAQQGASQTVTRTGSPNQTQTQTVKSGGVQNQGDLSKLVLGMTAYNKLGKDPLAQKLIGGAGSLLESGYDSLVGNTGTGAAAFDMAGLANFEQALAPVSASSDFGMSGLSSDLGYMTDMNTSSFADLFTGASSSADAAPVATDAIEETAGNFPVAPTDSSSGLASNPSASEVLVGANSGDAASIEAGGFDAASSASAGLGTATSGISYGASTASSVGSLDTGYNLGSGVAEAGGTTTSLAGSGGSEAASGGGSILGYVGPVLNALNAQNNPKGEQNKDYRKAVGGAVLNYFGYGWATPIVDAIARPILNEAMDAGNESLGNFGSVLADPIGAPLSGQYDVGELVTSTLDPGNIFGGNEGGSVGGVIAMGLDPIGAALGDTGVFSAAKDSINKVDSAIAPGRVVCTELAFSGALPMEKYQRVIQPDITLTGRILLGYHMLGIPAVRKLRADPKFVLRALPYVNAYLDHKLGKRNLIGFLIKNLGEPLCWVLSFFNKDPEAYKTLYPYRRNRNGN